MPPGVEGDGARPSSRDGPSLVFDAAVPKVLPDASLRRLVPTAFRTRWRIEAGAAAPGSATRSSELDEMEQRSG